MVIKTCTARYALCLVADHAILRALQAAADGGSYRRLLIRLSAVPSGRSRDFAMQNCVPGIRAIRR
jgi:hypothetical protein